MRITSIFLPSLFVFSFFCISAESQKGYAKDDQGRILVYRAQPSWWSVPSGAALAGLGAYVMHDAYYHARPKVKMHGSLSLGDIMPDLHKILARIRLYVPIDIEGKPARAIKGALGAGIALSGVSVLGSWIYNYAKLSMPLIVIDREGLQYEGKNKIFWKDVKSVRVVCDTSFNWSNDTGKIKRKYALEIVDAYDKLLIGENDIAITVDTLHDLIKKYCNKWW